MKKNYKKILITCFGLPNNSSEQSNNDPLLFANFLHKNNFKVELLCISNLVSYTTNQKNSQIYKKLNKNYKTTIVKIKNNKLNNFLQKLKIIFLKNKFNYNLVDDDFKNIRKKIDEINPDLILNFSEITLVALYNLNYKVINYVFLDREKIEKIKIKQFFKNLNFDNIFKILNSLLYLFVYKKIRNKIYSFPKVDIYPGDDPPKFIKKKNLIISSPLVNNNFVTKNNKRKVTKNIQILMMGNNKSTFVIDGLFNFSENLIDIFDTLQTKNKIKINIIGKFLPPKKVLKQINFKWIKFLGWVKNIDKFYEKSYFLLAPNRIGIGVRTKILDAMRHGLPVLTYYSSDFKNSGFINNKNILMAKDNNEMKKNIKKIINDNIFAHTISKNSKLLFKKRYNNNNNIKKTLNKVFKIL